MNLLISKAIRMLHHNHLSKGQKAITAVFYYKASLALACKPKSKHSCNNLISNLFEVSFEEKNNNGLPKFKSCSNSITQPQNSSKMQGKLLEAHQHNTAPVIWGCLSSQVFSNSINKHNKKREMGLSTRGSLSSIIKGTKCEGV